MLLCWMICGCSGAAQNSGTLGALQQSGVLLELDRPCHIQGLARVEKRLVASCVDRERERALLLAFDPSGGKPLLTKDVTEGALIHPSGLHFDGTWLWNALAGYTRAGPTKVQRLDPKTLEVTAAFQVSDHIGTISSDGEGTLHGFNWDALQMYVWRQDGTLLRKVDNPTGYAFQDCEIAVGKLWCCGIHKPTDSSAVLVMDPTNLAVKRTLPVPRATARRHGCHEGMTVEKDRLLLAPLDFPRARIFVVPRSSEPAAKPATGK